MGMQNPKFSDIDDYISHFPQETQEILKNLRKIVHEEAPNITELIRYDMPSFSLKDKLVLHFAAYKNHVSLFGITIESFKEELTPLLHHQGTIQLPLAQPIPYDLFKRLVKYRVQNEILLN